MRKLSLALLLFFTPAPALLAQEYKVKTIFEFLHVPPTTSDIFLTTPEKKADSISGHRQTRGWWDTAITAEIQKAIRGLSSLYREVQKSKEPLSPEHVLEFGREGNPFELQSDAKGYRIVSDNGEQKKIGSFMVFDKKEVNRRSFNAYDSNYNSIVFNDRSWPIFDRRFQYAEELEDDPGYFKFYEGKKAGIADSLGNILLPAKYDDAEIFWFNKKIWFWIKDNGKTWYMGQGSKHYFEKEDKRPDYLSPLFPDIVADRYWVLEGRVYDMQQQEELFASVKERIYAVGAVNKAVFYIRMEVPKHPKYEWEYRQHEFDYLYFDANGVLLLGQPLRSEMFDFNYNPLASVFVKDTVIDEKVQIYYKTGLLNDDFAWILQPEYYLYEVDDSAILFISPYNKTKSRGLMDKRGKVLVPEGRFLDFSKAGFTGRYICELEDSSFLFNKSSGRFSLLEKNFTEIWNYYHSYNTPYLTGVAESEDGERDIYYWMDTSYHLLDTTGWAHLAIEKDEDIVRCLPFVNNKFKSAAESYFFTKKDRKPITLTYKGRTRSTFADVDEIGPGMFFYKFRKGPNIVQTGPGTFFETNWPFVEYDPQYGWYIGIRSGKGSNEFGLMDKKGKALTSFMFKEIKPFSQRSGTASFKLNDTDQQQLDENGRLVFEGKYQSVVPVAKNYFIVTKNKLKGLLHISSKEILPVQYKYLEIKYGLVWFGEDEETAQSKPVWSLFKM